MIRKQPARKRTHSKQENGGLRCVGRPLMLVFVMTLLSGGCEGNQRGMNGPETPPRQRRMTDVPRDVLRRIDPTGLTGETAEREKVWADARAAMAVLQERLQQLDINQLNEAVRNLTETIAAVRAELDQARIADGIQTLSRTLESLHQDLDQDDPDSVVSSLRDLIDELNRKVQAIDIEQYNAVAQEAAKTLAAAERTLSSVDSELRPTVTELRNVADTANNRIQQLPIDELSRTAGHIDETSATLRKSIEAAPPLPQEAAATLATIRMAAWFVAAAFGIGGVCGLVWLIRQGRTRTR